MAARDASRAASSRDRSRHLELTPLFLAGRVVALAGELAEHLTSADEVRRHDLAVVESVRAMTKFRPRRRRRQPTGRSVAPSCSSWSRRTPRTRSGWTSWTSPTRWRWPPGSSRRRPMSSTVERGRYDLVILDEYQDTGVAQRRLLSGIFGEEHAVTAVGDPNQAIYGWRGASVGNLLRFGTHFSPARRNRQPLMTSFRCGGRILQAANIVAARARHVERGRPSPAQVASRARPRCRQRGRRRCRPRPAADRRGRGRLARRQDCAELEAGHPAREIAVLSRRRVDFPRLHRRCSAATFRSRWSGSAA